MLVRIADRKDDDERPGMLGPKPLTCRKRPTIQDTCR